MDAALDAVRIGLGQGATDAERARALEMFRAIERAIASSPTDTQTPTTHQQAPTPGAMSTALAHTSATAPAPADVIARGLAQLEQIATALADPGVAADVHRSLSGLDIDAMLDAALASLRTALPNDRALPAPVGRPFRVPLLPLPSRVS